MDEFVEFNLTVTGGLELVFRQSDFKVSQNLAASRTILRTCFRIGWQRQVNRAVVGLEIQRLIICDSFEAGGEAALGTDKGFRLTYLQNSMNC